jgi:hypothetical protein
MGDAIQRPIVFAVAVAISPAPQSHLKPTALDGG